MYESKIIWNRCKKYISYKIKPCKVDAKTEAFIVVLSNTILQTRHPNPIGYYTEDEHLCLSRLGDLYGKL